MSGRPISVAGAVISFGPGVLLGLTYLFAPVPDGQKIYLAVGVFALASIVRDILIPKEDVLAAQLFDIPWLFYAMIVVIPGVALWLQDDRIIKAGPTLYFCMVAALSVWSASTERPRLQRFVKRDALRNVDREGWRSLTLYAAGSCLLMAVMNEVVWRNSSTGFWIVFQIFGWLVLQLVLMALSIRIIRKNVSKYKPDVQSRGIPLSTPTDSKPTGSGSQLLIDVGPLLVFFAANFFAPVPPALKIFVATGAFMAAMVAAMLYSALRFGRISPMLWFSGVLVVVMGGVTLWLHDETFIKMKPTFYYLLIAALLAFGLWADKPLLKRVLGSSYPGLDEAGWRKLTRNWALFFAFMAALNEAVWRNFSTDFWVGFKLWGAIPLTFLFALANIPMLLKHGLNRDDAAPAEPGPVE